MNEICSSWTFNNRETVYVPDVGEWFRLVDLYITDGTELAGLQVAHDASLTNCKRTMQVLQTVKEHCKSYKLLKNESSLTYCKKNESSLTNCKRTSQVLQTVKERCKSYKL